MKRALEEFIVEGIKTTVPFHQQLMDNKDFQDGNFTTKFLDTFELKPEKIDQLELIKTIKKAIYFVDGFLYYRKLLKKLNQIFI